MQKNVHKSGLEMDKTDQFIRDLLLPAEPSEVEKEPTPRKRVKVNSVKSSEWRKIDSLKTTQQQPEGLIGYPNSQTAKCFSPFGYIKDGESLMASQYNQCDAMVNTDDGRNDLEVSSSNYVASEVQNVVDPQGTVRGLTGGVPELPVCSTGMVSSMEDTSRSLDVEKKDYIEPSQRDYIEPEQGFLQPPALSDFSEISAAALVDRLRDEEALEDGVRLLIQWMEDGKCTKGNAFSLFSLFQAIEGLVSRLMKDTAKLEEEVRQHQCTLNRKCVSISLHLEEILKVFDIVSSQKVWNHFSETQRNRIDLWRKHIEEIEESNSRDLLLNQVKENIILSNNEDSAKRLLVKQQGEEIRRLVIEIAQLSSQLEKLKNYVNLQSSNHGMNKNPTASDGGMITEKEANIAALIGKFLGFNRSGESIDCIVKYLSNMDLTVTTGDIEQLMRKFPTVFKEESVESNDNPKTKWTFLGF